MKNIKIFLKKYKSTEDLTEQLDYNSTFQMPVHSGLFFQGERKFDICDLSSIFSEQKKNLKENQMSLFQLFFCYWIPVPWS